jgi:hypothetical protein
LSSSHSTGTPSATTLADAVAAYFTAVLNKDSEALRELFTDDAEFSVPGANLIGNDAIADFYRTTFAQSAPQPAPGPLLTCGNRVSVEITLNYQGKDLRMADFFTVDAGGRISRLFAYQAVDRLASG